MTEPTTSTSSGATAPPAPLVALFAAVEAAVDITVDELSEQELRRVLPAVHRAHTQLDMLRTTLVGALQERAARARRANGGPPRITEEGAKYLREEFQLSPAEAKRTAKTAKDLQERRQVRDACQRGEVGQAHAAVVTRMIREVEPPFRDALEAELLQAATRMDVVALGRLARRRVADLAPKQAEKAARHRHLRRRASMRQDEHGDVHFSGSCSGVAAETLITAWRAFTAPPTATDHRTHEQRGADAFEAMALAALRAGDAPTQHGERPHVLVVVQQQDLLRGSGIAHLGHTGPIPVSEIGPLLRDCAMTHIGIDPKGAPIAVTGKLRTVPVGLWRALQVRDGGCTWDGCSAPASWCDVAHGADPYRNGGKLSPANSALLCRRHHRQFDHRAWRIVVEGDRVRYLPGGSGGTTDPPGTDPPSRARCAASAPREPMAPGERPGPAATDGHGARDGSTAPSAPDAPPGPGGGLHADASAGRSGARPVHLPGLAGEPRGSYLTAPVRADHVEASRPVGRVGRTWRIGRVGRTWRVGRVGWLPRVGLDDRTRRPSAGVAPGGERRGRRRFPAHRGCNGRRRHLEERNSPPAEHDRPSRREFT
ncbi:MAG: DUF222 domain-containing protein [Nitriliruptoraceae bacterium]|nr:DUF222 domain-containing protein [Nitriliruptoraceae bacterium]